MKKTLQYELKIKKGHQVSWELFNAPINMNRNRYMSYYGDDSIDEFAKIIRGWSGNLQRSVADYWVRTEIEEDE